MQMKGSRNKIRGRIQFCLNMSFGCYVVLVEEQITLLHPENRWTLLLLHKLGRFITNTVL